MKAIISAVTVLLPVLFFSCMSEKVIISDKKGRVLQDTCSSGDCKEGHGTWVYKQGDSYTGFWKSGRRHGRGTMTWYSVSELSGINKKTETEKYYRGPHFELKSNHLAEGHPAAIGALLLLNSHYIYGQIKKSIEESESTTEVFLRYTGDWKNDMLYGYGSLYLPNNKIIRGYWKENVYDGER